MNSSFPFILFCMTLITIDIRPGLLTKGPSEALQMIARMTPTSDSEYKGMDSFFMVGVKPTEPEERVMTPSQSKKGSDEKFKVSNRCKYEENNITLHSSG